MGHLSVPHFQSSVESSTQCVCLVFPHQPLYGHFRIKDDDFPQSPFLSPSFSLFKRENQRVCFENVNIPPIGTLSKNNSERGAFSLCLVEKSPDYRNSFRRYVAFVEILCNRPLSPFFVSECTSQREVSQSNLCFHF